MKQLIQSFSIFSLLFLLNGCFFEEPDLSEETMLDISILASGTETPLAVNFFALRSDEAFKRLDYFELMKKKSSGLNGDIITQSKKILSPGEMEKRSIKLSKDIRYYAVVVGFENVDDNDNWRYIQEIIPETRNDITLVLNQDSMEKVTK